MTINIANNSPRINYTATSGQTVYTVPFEFFDNTDLKVYIEGTLKTITTHYTVSGGNGSTGTVTLVTGATLNDEVTLVRDVPMERTTDLTANYNAASLDGQLDRIVAEIADLDDRVSRTIQINDYELASGLLLPALDSRKGKTIQFNTSTGALEVGPTGADLTAIGSVTSEIATLAGISGNITTVAGSNAQVVAVGNAMTSITAINSALSNVNTVAGGISNINLVGGSISDVNDVADSLGEISAVQAKLTNIDTVAIASTNIGTVAGSIAQVNSVASKIADVTGVNTNISAITTANANSTNVNLVANSIDDVNDVGTVITKVTTVADNIANVNLVAPNAQYLSDVANNITAINAIAPLADDLTNVTNNLSAIQNAGTNATNAATSASSAATSATAAQTAKTAAETALDEFTDIYLGSKSVAPTVDNDGNALATGSIYWNSGVDQLYIWDGSAWDDAAFTASGAVTSFNTRSGAVTLSSADVTNAAGLLRTGGAMTGDLSFGDNDKAIFGAGSDLQIYHTTTGNHSIIAESGAGNLILAADNLEINNAANNANKITATTSGAVTLFHNNAAKLATTSTGIDVTGTVTADGLTVQSNNYLDILDADNHVSGRLRNVSGSNNALTIEADPANSASGTFMSFKIDTSEAMRIDSSGRVGIGTSFPTLPLDIVSNSGADALKIRARPNGDDYGTLTFYNNAGTTKWADIQSNVAKDLRFYTNGGSERMRIDSSGNVGIGCTPSHPLEVQSGGVGTVLRAGTAFVSIDSVGSAASPSLIFNGDGDTGIWRTASDTLAVATGGTERMRITSTGQVGIGTSSPNASFKATLSGLFGLRIQSADTNNSALNIGCDTNSGVSYIDSTKTGTGTFLPLRFATGDAERMRLDASGNLLVGTATAYGTTGTTINQAGLIYSSANSDRVGQFDLTGNDGEIVRFSKAGTTAGSIGVEGGDLVIGTGTNCGLQFNDGNTAIRPFNIASNAAVDNAVDLGVSGTRFKDLYLSGGVYLGGTGSANKLDDYEEGTWTPTNAYVTISSNDTARYTKVGNLVTVTFYITYPSGSNGNPAEVRGLPFTVAKYATGAGNSNASAGSIVLRANLNSTTIEVMNTSNTSIAAGTLANKILIGTISYETSQ